MTTEISSVFAHFADGFVVKPYDIAGWRGNRPLFMRGLVP